MFIPVALLIVLGGIFILLGFLIWKKEKITLLHDYHRAHVCAEQQTAFCTLCGISLLIIGISLAVTGILLAVTDSALSFLLFGAGMIIGVALLIHAETKYNRPQK